MQIVLARTVTICDMNKSNMFLHVPRHVGKKYITFNQSFVSKHQTFLFENFCLGKKRWSKAVGTFKKFWDWGTETFSVQSKIQASCDMDVIGTI